MADDRILATALTLRADECSVTLATTELALHAKAPSLGLDKNRRRFPKGHLRKIIHAPVD